MFGFITNYYKEEETIRRQSDTLGSVTKEELMMIVRAYGYRMYQRVKNDEVIYRSTWCPNFGIDGVIDRIMADRVIKELEGE